MPRFSRGYKRRTFNRGRRSGYNVDYFKDKDRFSGGAAMSFGNKQIATLYNPFSMKNFDPKWPDGKTTYSIGNKVQRVTDVDKGNCENLIIVLFAGINNWCQCFKRPVNSTDYLQVFSHSLSRQDSVLLSEFQTPSGTGTTTTVPSPDELDRQTWILYKNPNLQSYVGWRPVSVGLKIDCINSDEDNDGWFECIRTERTSLQHAELLSLSSQATETIFDNTDSHIIGPCGIGFNHDILNTWYMAKDWSLQPTYQTGKLHNLSRYMFQLNPVREDNDFRILDSVNIPNSSIQRNQFGTLEADGEEVNSYFTSTAYSNGASVLEFYEFRDLSTADDIVQPQVKLDKFKRDIFHDSFDMIIIRVHGLNKTRLKFHSVYNVEYIEDEYKKSNHATASYAAMHALSSFRNYRNRFGHSPYQYLGRLDMPAIENRFYN